MSTPMLSRIVLVLAVISANGFAAFGADDAVVPTFEMHIQPFLKTYCVGCHNGDDDSKGGLDVRSFKSLMEGGDGGAAIVPGKSGESRLVKMLLGMAKPKMPPKDSKQPKADEIELVKRWVDLGAKGPETSTPQTADKLKLPQVKSKVSVSAAITATAYSPNGKWLAAARHRDVVLFDAATGSVVQTIAGAENPINTLAFSADGRFLAAGEGFASVAGRVCVWEVGEKEKTDRGGTPRIFGTGHADSVYAVAFSPDGKLLATASYDKLVILWDIALGMPRHTLKHHTGAVFGIAFSPDGKALASVAADQTVKLWNVETGQRILTLTEPTKGLNAVAFRPILRDPKEPGRAAPDPVEFAAAGADKMIRIWEWNAAAARLKKSTFAHDAPILALVYAPDGKTLFTSSEDRRIKAWDAETLRERHVYDALPDWPLSLAVSPTGKQLAAGLYNGDLTVFDAGAAGKVKDLLMGRREVAGSAAKPQAVEERTTAGGPLPAPPRIRGGESGTKPNLAAPRLDAISPRTVVRGSKVKLTFSGQNLWDADRVFVQPGNLPVTLLPGDEKNQNKRMCEIDLPAGMPPGLVQLRLHTPLGSTAAKSFYVGPFAEVAEKEPNNTRDRAVPATLPVTLSGAIDTKGDRDCWSFDASEGQELVFQLVGANLGSALTAQLTLLDDAGKSLASTARQPGRSDVVLGHRFDITGKYVLQVEDRNFTGGGNHFYAIHAGQFAYVTGVFPLGLRSGEPGGVSPRSAPVSTDGRETASGEVTSLGVRGFNLAPESRIGPLKSTGTQSLVLEAPGGRTLNTARFESSPFPEFVETEPNDTPQQARLLSVPTAISGHIVPARSPSTAPDADHVAFHAKQGDRLTIEVFARRLGSPLDSVIDILTADGQPVGRHTLRAVAETYTVLRDHDSRVRGIRLNNWEDFQANDLLLLGGEVVKVQIIPLGPDEDVKFFEKGTVRLGFLGTTPQAHALNSAAYKVEVHPPGMTFPPNGMPVVQLNYTNDDGGPEFQGDSRILFDVPADGKYVVRLRDVRDLAGDDFFYRLVIRPRNEDFRLSLDPENPNIPRGGSRPVTVNAERLDGFNGPIDVRLEGLPAGITATTGRIDADSFNCTVTLTAAEEAPQPAGDEGLQLKVLGQAKIDGRAVEHGTTPAFGGHQVTITSPPDLLVRVEPAVAAISPGQEQRFTVTIERRNDFKGRVPIDVLNLPHGLRVLDVGLNGVLITEESTSRTFVVHCDPWAEPGPHPFYAAARVESKGNERHASPPLRLEVKSSGSVAAKAN